VVASTLEDRQELVLKPTVARSTIGDTRADRIFSWVNYALLGAYLLVVLYPLLYILSASFSSPAAVTSGRVKLLPVEPTWISYETIFRDPAIVRGFLN
jgi:putative aldouronate transport system permease protein